MSYFPGAEILQIKPLKDFYSVLCTEFTLKSWKENLSLPSALGVFGSVSYNTGMIGSMQDPSTTTESGLGTS
jgi:hypothetical protein